MVNNKNMVFDNGNMRGFHKWGKSPKCLVYFMENPVYKWMRTGGSPIYRNLHIGNLPIFGMGTTIWRTHDGESTNIGKIKEDPPITGGGIDTKSDEHGDLTNNIQQCWEFLGIFPGWALPFGDLSVCELEKIAMKNQKNPAAFIELNGTCSNTIQDGAPQIW